MNAAIRKFVTKYDKNTPKEAKDMAVFGAETGTEVKVPL